MDCIILEQIPLSHPNELNIDMISRTKKMLPEMVEIQILSDSSVCPRIIRCVFYKITLDWERSLTDTVFAYTHSVLDSNLRTT